MVLICIYYGASICGHVLLGGDPVDVLQPTDIKQLCFQICIWIFFQAKLDDSHYQMIIHWAGENSDVIVALTRDLEPIDNPATSTSRTYLSYDYGKNFQVKTMALNRTHNATIDKFYNSPVYNSHVSTI